MYDCGRSRVHPFYAVTGTITVPGDYRMAARTAAKPDRANPTNTGIDADRGAADFPLEFPLEFPLKLLSSAAYGSLPSWARPGSLGPELWLSPSCEVTGSQWV